MLRRSLWLTGYPLIGVIILLRRDTDKTLDISSMIRRYACGATRKVRLSQTDLLDSD